MPILVRAGFLEREATILPSAKCLHNSEAPGVCVVFMNGEVRFVIEETIYHMGASRAVALITLTR